MSSFFREFADRFGARTADCFVMPFFGAGYTAGLPGTVAGQNSLLCGSLPQYEHCDGCCLLNGLCRFCGGFSGVDSVLRERETTVFQKVNFAAKEFLPFLAGVGLTSDLNASARVRFALVCRSSDRSSSATPTTVLALISTSLRAP